MITIKKATSNPARKQIAILIIAHPGKIKNAILELAFIFSFICLPGSLEYIDAGGSPVRGIITFALAAGYLIAFSYANTVRGLI